MKRARTVTGWLLIGLLGGALAQGCGASSNSPRVSGTGAAAGSAGKDAGSMTVEPPGNGGNGGESQFDPLCGIAEVNGCVPDSETNSVCLEGIGGKGGSGGSKGTSTGAGAGTGGRATGGTGASKGGTGPGTGGTGPTTGGTGAISAGGAGGESGAEGGVSQGGAAAAAGDLGSSRPQSGQGGERSGAAGESTIGGAGSPSETGTGGTLASGGRSGSGGQSTGSVAGGTSVPASVSCQVVESPAHKGTPVATCRPAGTGTKGAPCFSGADCAPKFACVGSGPGQCLPYCCSGPTECEAYIDTHCAVEALVPDPQGSRSLQVPVCVPAVKCSLAEPYPCPKGVTCSCPDDSACVVVSDNGTTSCLPVSKLGTGVAPDDACPCAWGNVCSQATNHCVKLCEVAAGDAVCDSGRCQASAALPSGWGTCVGEARDGGAQ
jgi:hypothetical protein